MAEEKALALQSLVSQEQQDQFALICKEAGALQLASNCNAAFTATIVVSQLRAFLTDEIIDKVFRPLMNTRIGFMTDRRPTTKNPHPTPYSNAIIRDAIIDGLTIGLFPTGNQINIIAERMYPTKEGFTALLRKMGVKYIVSIGADTNRIQGYAEIPCKVDYMYNGEKNSFTLTATVRKDEYSSPDQLRGKAERRAKKALYEYITGCDFGDADEDSSRPIEDAHYEVVKENANGQKMPGAAPAGGQQNPPAAPPQPKPAAQPTSQPAGARPTPSIFANL